MTVFALAQFSIHDRQRYDRYAAQFFTVLREFEGRLLAADESPQVVEGEWDRDKVVLIAFPDADAFERWHQSAAYRAISVDREAATQGSVLLVSGFDQPG